MYFVNIFSIWKEYKMCSLKISIENVKKKTGGPTSTVSDSSSSLMTLNELAIDVRENLFVLLRVSTGQSIQIFKYT